MSSPKLEALNWGRFIYLPDFDCIFFKIELLLRLI